MSDRQFRRCKRRAQRHLIRLFDVPPELIGGSRWDGGVWWRLRRTIRRRGWFK